jgi:hypothetical protein
METATRQIVFAGMQYLTREVSPEDSRHRLRHGDDLEIVLYI